MIDNPIVDEVPRIREEMLAEFNGDLSALMREMQRRTEEARSAGKAVVSPMPRRSQETAPTKKVG